MIAEKTDRELLELAAKAAGFEVKKNAICVDAEDAFIGIKVRLAWNDRYCKWNPLADDGDALRPMAKLCISIEYFDRISGDFIEAQTRWASGTHPQQRVSLINLAPNDALRRAASMCERLEFY